MFTVAASVRHEGANLTARCTTHPDKPGVTLEVLTHDPPQRVLSHHVPHWDDSCLIHVSCKLVLFAYKRCAMMLQPLGDTWTITPFEFEDPINIILGCDDGQHICVVTNLGVLIVRCRDLALVKSFGQRGVVQIFCRSVVFPDDNILLLTYLTDRNIVYVVKIDNSGCSKRMSPTHGCIQCSSEPCTRLIQDPRCDFAFLAIHDNSHQYTFFIHTPTTIWTSKSKSFLDGEGQIETLFANWRNYLTKYPFSN